MPPPSSQHQKVLIAQFIALTGASTQNATRCLKATGFKINDAIDSYYATNSDAKGPSPLEMKLESMFAELQDASDEKDQLGIDTTMTYLTEKLGVNIENAELLLALEILQAPTVGVITKKGYVGGWKSVVANGSHQEHATYVRKQTANLSSDPNLFKKVYKYTFVLGRENDQKALTLENALVYWDILFSSPGVLWVSKNHNWLDLWKEFLGAKWTRSVNRDMWNMTLEFARKSMVDESLSFWNEDGAWPGVIDAFVEWCHEKGIGKADGMDVDEH